MARLLTLPSRRLSPNPRERGMFFSIVEGSMFSVWVSALSGSYLTGAALHLGAGGFELGILGALPALSTMLQLGCAPMVVGLEKRRSFLATWSAMQRFCGALAGLLALWLYPSPAALVVFVGMHVLAWAFMAPSTVVWQGYMSDLVPATIRGRYFAKRNAWCGGVAMAAVLLYGAVLDRWPGATGFYLLYLGALIGAALNLASWFLLPELPPGETRSTRPFWESVRIPLAKAGPHRTAAFFFSAWALAQGLAAPFYSVALVQKLGISFSGVSVLATIQTLTAIATMGFWGRLQDRIGQARTIGLLTGMIAVVPLLFLAAGLGGWPVLVAAHLLNGTAASALGLAHQTLNMKLAPTEDRGAYFAFFAAAGGLTGFLTPALVGPLTGAYLDWLFGASAVVSAALSLIWRARVETQVASA